MPSLPLLRMTSAVNGLSARRNPADLNVSALLAGGSLEFGHQIGGYPAAVFHLDALCPGPLADIGRVQDARRPGAIAAGRLASAAAHPAGRAHVSGQRIPQLPGVPCVQVDLVLGAVQTESMNRVCIF